MLSYIRYFVRDEKAATAIEYALIAALVGVIIIGGLTTLGPAISEKFNSISNSLNNA